MKKLLRMLLAAVFLCSALIIGASAADFTHLADDLSELGLFKGTDDGYQLEEIPDRSQAVIMLIRLMGAEEEALAGDYSHPFIDVPAWAYGYIGYAYEKGYVKGISADKFGTGLDCTENMYCALMLRALGYSEEAGDFEYEYAAILTNDLEISSLIIIDNSVYVSELTRDKMVATSFMTLIANMKSEEPVTLLETMMANEAVNLEKAEEIMERARLYKEITDAELVRDSQDELHMTFDITRETDWIFRKYFEKCSIETAYKGRDDAFEAYKILKFSYGGMPIIEENFYKNKVQYHRVDDKKWQAQSDTYFEHFENLQNMPDVGYLRRIKSISKEKDDEQTVYKVVFPEKIDSRMLEGSEKQLYSESAYEPIHYIITLDSDGRISEYYEEVKREHREKYEDETSFRVTSAIMETYHYKITGWGDDVKMIPFPEDIEEWPEFDGEYPERFIPYWMVLDNPPNTEGKSAFRIRGIRDKLDKFT